MAAVQQVQTKSKAEELGEHIKRFRVARSLDLSDVADRCGVKVSIARDWETGDAIPAPREWVRLRKMVARGLTAYADLWRAAIEDRESPGIAAQQVVTAQYMDATLQLKLEPAAMELIVADEAPRPEDADSLGECLRRARLIEGLSQAELGEMLGVEQCTISSWEVERNTPVRDHLNRLAELIPAIARWRDDTRDIPKPMGPLGMTFKSDPRAAAQMVIEASDTERGLPRIPEIRHDAYHTDPDAKPMERFEDDEPEIPITLDALTPHERLKELGTRHVEFLLERSRARKDVEDCNAALVAARADLEAADRDLSLCLADMTRTIEEITNSKG